MLTQLRPSMLSNILLKLLQQIGKHKRTSTLEGSICLCEFYLQVGNTADDLFASGVHFGLELMADV